MEAEEEIGGLGPGCLIAMVVAFVGVLIMAVLIILLMYLFGGVL